MEDRKNKIQQSKKFYNEFLKLMDHYKLVTKEQKAVWERSMNPEKYANEQKKHPNMDRDEKIAALKAKKQLEAMIDKYRDSDDLQEQ